MAWTLVCLWGVVGAVPHKASSEPKSKLGLSTALTGAASQYGLDIRNTVAFANKVLAHDAYEIVVDDDKCDGKTSITVAKKLVEIDGVREILGYTCSSSLMAAASYLERKKVVTIAVAATAPQIADAGEYIFRTIQGDREGAKLLYERAVKRYRKLGVLSAQNEWNEGIRRELLSFPKSDSLALVVEEVLPTPYEYRTSLSKLIRGGADALFLNVMPEAAFLAALKQVQELHFTGEVLAFYHPGSESFRASVSGELPPIYYVDNASPERILTPEGRALYAEFVKEYGALNSVPLTFASTFEAFRAIHQAIQSGRDRREYIATTTFNGIFGPWSFDPKGEIVGLNVELVEFQR